MAKTTESELRELLEQAALGISELSSNPRTWQSWLVYLLEHLEAQARANPAHNESFKEMLPALQDAIRNRLKTGGW